MTKSPDLYTSIVDVTADYLGPAAKRFIDRQIQNHLAKEPEQLRSADMPELIDWVMVSTAFLTEDRQLIDDLAKRLKQLSAPKRAR